MPSIEDRRAIAKTLRRVAAINTDDLSDGEFVDFVTEIVLGGDVRMDPQDRDAAFLNRLADLIDPAEHERTVADNLKIIDRNRELERELARAKRKLERTRRQAQIDNERAVLADKIEDENLELKKRLGCFDDVTPPVSWYESMREKCEQLESELAEAYRRQDD